MKAILTVIGQDKVGIVAGISNKLLDLYYKSLEWGRDISN